MSRLSLLAASCWTALFGGLGAEGASCGDAAACQERMRTLMEKLQSTEESMSTRRQTMTALEGFRSGLMHGERVHLPSAQRQYLEKGSPLVGEVSYDAKHRPLSTNISKSMKHARTIVNGSNFRLQGLLPIKKPASGGGSTVLIATLESESKLSLRTPDGETRLDGFDLGHKVTHLSLSVNLDHNFVFTGDAAGEMRVLMIEPVLRNISSSASSDEDEVETTSEKKRPTKQLVVFANTTAKFLLPSSGDGRQVASVLIVDRGAQPLFVVGDSLGSVAVFFKNGTLKGRIKVTDDPGGVIGLRRGSGQTVLFFSSHSFGFLSVTQVDVSSPPCTGWNSPVFDVASDPQSTYARVVLALSDGDVLVFSTTGKNKERTCDLTLKFPRMSSVPFQLHVSRGHIMGVPTPLEGTEHADERNRDLYFFNTAAMEAGYGSGQSRIVTLQASFHPRRLTSFALQNSAGSGGSGPAKAHLVLQFAGQSAGLELYDLNLKTPAVTRAEAGSGGSDMWSWLEWVPKVGILGITLIGVVVWNIRKISGGKQKSSGGGLGGGFQEEMLKERLAAKRREGKQGESGLDDMEEKIEALSKKAGLREGGKSGAPKAAAGGASGSMKTPGGLDLDRDLDSLNASSREMEELLASMGDD